MSSGIFEKIKKTPTTNLSSRLNNNSITSSVDSVRSTSVDSIGLDSNYNYDSEVMNRSIYTNRFLRAKAGEGGSLIGGFFSYDYDEPTYLSFRIDFDTVSNTINNKASSFGYALPYDLIQSPLFDIDSEYSTYKYLKDSQGEAVRASYIKKFIDGINDIQKNFPFYIQEINGIDSLVKVDPKRGTRVPTKESGAVLTVKCLEGLDMRMKGLFDLYKKAVWDETYQRWICPDMMRWFNMRLYITDFRIFHQYSPEYVEDGLNPAGNNSINNMMPTICYECQQCEFMINDPGMNFSSFKNNEIKEPSSFEIKISVGNVTERSAYPLFKTPVFISDKYIINQNVYGPTDNTVNSDLAVSKLHNRSYYINYDAVLYSVFGRDKYDVDVIGGLPKVVKAVDPNESSSRSNMVANMITNATKWGLGWVNRTITDITNNVITNTEWMKGISIVSIANALKSENIINGIGTLITENDAYHGRELDDKMADIRHNKTEVEMFIEDKSNYVRNNSIAEDISTFVTSKDIIYSAYEVAENVIKNYPEIYSNEDTKKTIVNNIMSELITNEIKNGEISNSVKEDLEEYLQDLEKNTEIVKYMVDNGSDIFNKIDKAIKDEYIEKIAKIAKADIVDSNVGQKTIKKIVL